MEKTLLLVEDEAIIALSTTRQLQSLGYKVIHAIKGEKAVDIFLNEEAGIDLILMDIDLGKGLDGPQTAEIILKERDIPVVFLSSHTEIEIVAKTETITSYGYVVKNSGLTILDASIKMAFKLFQAHLEINRKNMLIKAGNENLRETIEKLELLNKSHIQTEEQLLKNSSRYKRAQEIGHLGNWEYDIKTNLIWGSEEALKIYNLPVDTVSLDLEAVETMDYDKAKMKQALMDLILHEKPYDIVFQIKPFGTDKWKWLHSVAELIKDESGNPIRVEGVVQDISKSKETESSLELLNKAIQNSSDIIFTTNKKGIITSINKTFTRVYGYEADEVVNRQHPGILNFDPIEINMEMKYWAELDLHENLRMEFKNRTKTGEAIFVEAMIDPIFDEYGNSTGYLITQRNITEKKEAEENLKKSEQLLSITLQSIGDGVLATDMEGKITRMNATAERLTGWSFKDAVNKPITDVFNIINASTRIPVENPVKTVLKTGKVMGLANNTILISKTGEEYQISDSAAPICDSKGNLYGLILVFSDVSRKYETN